jgi:hypothetical protein
MRNRLRALTFLIVWGALANGTLSAQDRPTITFSNQSGDSALVRLEGPSARIVPVPDGASRTVEVSGGVYRIFVRYGDVGKYRYTKGRPFSVTETAFQVSEIFITLHRVVGGNYESDPSNETEFRGGR